jgi:hypothetical protein
LDAAVEQRVQNVRAVARGSAACVVCDVCKHDRPARRGRDGVQRLREGHRFQQRVVPHL